MSNIEKLIIKYLNNSISKEEWGILSLWVEQNRNAKEFKEYLRVNYAIEYIMREFNTEKTKNSLLEKIKKDKRAVISLNIKRYLKVAAVVAMVLSIGYVFKQDFKFNKTKEIVAPSEDTIILELENGNFEVISEGEVTEIKNAEGEVIGTQNGNRLSYNSIQSDNEALVYNQLKVPFGKRFELEFSDGTVAHLNAGSSLKYPVNFLEEGKREIFLVGEVYLDVVKDANRPFIVNTSDNLDIEVYGTQFNVSNFPEDKTTEVVLVEGSVGMYVAENDETLILEPGFKGSFNRRQKNITTKPVITDVYTSWINGGLVFRQISLENILKKLERHYNVTITNNNLEYAQKRFNANFGDEPVETVLKYFKNTYGIDYTINANHIEIN
ncbi:FecR domain-containing protein [Maribacter sp. R77961]|uniref:FecR family protein n=1 Tax=Maribacter sp. R77961 TaxID=3093871 RepID=UPI0037CC8639